MKCRGDRRLPGSRRRRRDAGLAKSFDYEGEKDFFSDRVTEVAPYDWLVEDISHWVEDPLAAFSGKRVLEIGASEGLLAILIAERYGPRLYVASDLLYNRMIGAARRAFDMANLVIVAANAYRLPHPDSAFDVVVCNGALCHMPGTELVAAEVARVLKPGGLYLGREPNSHNPLVRYRTLKGPLASPNMTATYPEVIRSAFEAQGFEVEIKLFWRRLPRVSNRFLAVSQRITARLTRKEKPSADGGELGSDRPEG